MLDYPELAEVARYADAQTEELGTLEAYLKQIDVKPYGLVKVAEQRALRVAMIRDGLDPRKMSRTRFTPVHLSKSSRAEMLHLQSAWVDGFVIGLATKAQHG